MIWKDRDERAKKRESEWRIGIANKYEVEVGGCVLTRWVWELRYHNVGQER